MKKNIWLIFFLLFPLHMANADFRIELVEGDPIIVTYYVIKKEKKIIHCQTSDGVVMELDMNNVVSVDPIESYPSTNTNQTTNTNQYKNKSYSQGRQKKSTLKSYGNGQNKERIDSYQNKRKREMLEQYERKINALTEAASNYDQKVARAELELNRLRRDPDTNQDAINYLESVLEDAHFNQRRIYEELNAMKAEYQELLFSVM